MCADEYRIDGSDHLKVVVYRPTVLDVERPNFFAPVYILSYLCSQISGL